MPDKGWLAAMVGLGAFADSVRTGRWRTHPCITCCAESMVTGKVVVEVEVGPIALYTGSLAVPICYAAVRF